MSQERYIRQITLKGFGLEGQMYLLCQSGKRSETPLKQLRNQYPKSSIFSTLGALNQYLTTCS